ncbi:DUF2254 domain-containing protein [Celeribacter litoreus]|uniref:DUF2254 domain-containing protein n=1 Tax=Celeribacter litoreus TaxID=2876714 RepID=UPI001CCD58E2|nr:DUF2254 domain-containing protein [Celeribacter litoreus]MCA0044137.1 DUF2254 domain-containing protein [Celeribacter litoreus]
MFDVLRMPLLIFRRYYHALWLRVTLYALLSLAISLITLFLRAYLPETLSGRVDANAVMPVLTILASSMLAVSTFSLNVMVSAHTSAATASTPRVHRLLRQDTTTQSVLSAFIGAFIFALTTIILFRAGFYGDEEAIVVLAITVLVIAIIIVAMLRWIEHLSHLGSLDNSLDIATDAARRGLLTARRAPSLHANPLTSETILPEDTTPVLSRRTGYIQLIDMADLNGCAGADGLVYILHRPGTFVFEGQMLAQVAGPVSEDTRKEMAKAFVIGPDRTDEVDPVFSLMTLSEISSKALSPGVNDPGTAIEAVTRLSGLLWDAVHIEATPVRHTKVFCPPHTYHDFIEAAFAATARDGAGVVEVSEIMLKHLACLAGLKDENIASAARDMARRTLDYAEQAQPLDTEKARLREAFRLD